MAAFCDLPDEQRMALRHAICAAGGEVADYQGDSVQVALPRPTEPFFKAMWEAGLAPVPGSMCYFPLGGDASFTADHLRHDGSYPGSRGFWLYVRFVPAQPTRGE